MKLILQPKDGVAPLLKGIDEAKETIEILIFRFDHRQMEHALVRAVGRGVRVRALIAYTNRGGEKNLRALELRLLAAGVTVARTAGDLIRYHGKMIIIDQRKLYLLAFNFTYMDIDRSRSFGVIATDPDLIQEATSLFDADSQRQPYTPRLSEFIVSPVNARRELSAFIKSAKTELLLYDPSVRDPEILRLLEERSKSGVSIRLLGTTKRGAKFAFRPFNRMRLHTRTMIRDQGDVFVGSQSLRAAELDQRREIGVIFHDLQIAGALVKCFNEDWDLANVPAEEAVIEETLPAKKIAKKVAKAVTKDLAPVVPVVEGVVKEVAGEAANVDLDPDRLQDAVKDAVKNAVKEVVREAFDDAQTGHVAEAEKRNGP